MAQDNLIKQLPVQYLNCTSQQVETFFRNFSYPDFLTPNSGLIQIRKYAEIHNLQDLQEQFSVISALTKKVRDELYRLLVEEGGIFGVKALIQYCNVLFL
jgi:hypothetical protein